MHCLGIFLLSLGFRLLEPTAVQNILTIAEFRSPDRGPVLVLPFSSSGIFGANLVVDPALGDAAGRVVVLTPRVSTCFHCFFIGKALKIMIDYLTLLSIY